MIDDLDRGLHAVRDALDGLAARWPAIPVPAALRLLRGSIRDTPVELRTRRFADATYTLTLAEIAESSTGALRAVTAIGVPHGAPLPILGIDLIALQGSLALIAVDLAPTDDALWSDLPASLLGQLHLDTAGMVVARRWPEFATEVFSPRALLAGARRGHESAVLAQIAGFVASLAPLFASAPTATPAAIAAADARRHRWIQAERRNRREHDALARMFGEPSVAYLDLLFPPA